jgi:hypothetical protein
MVSALALAAVTACGDDAGEPHLYDAGVSSDGFASEQGDAGDEPDGNAPDAAVEDDASASARVSIAFEHTVNGAPLSLGCPAATAAADAYPYTNGTLHPFCVSKLRYFVSFVKIALVDGTQVGMDAAHLVDVAQVDTLLYSLPQEVPVGDVQSLSFVMGLAEPFNHEVAFSSADELSMAWPSTMGGGYHYMQLEGAFEREDASDGMFKAHTGYLCEDAQTPPAGQCIDRTFVVTLSGDGQRVTETASTFTIEMEIAKWFDQPHSWDLTEKFARMPGMMKNADMQKELMENGVDVFTLAD